MARTNHVVRIAAALLAMGMAAACEPDAGAPPGGGPRGGGDDDPETDASVTSCLRNEPGCPCSASAAVGCYPESVLDRDGQRICLSGAQYCRGGEWSECEVVLGASTPGVAEESLITGPTTCSDCDPRCFRYDDEPTSTADVTPANSSGVVLATSGSGVQLPPTGIYMGTGDMDGDGVPDDFDLYPNNPLADGFTEAGGIFHVLGAGATAGPDPVTIDTTIRTADIYVLMDATASMQGEIDNLQSSLTTGGFADAFTYPSVAVTGNDTFATAYDFGSDPVPGVYPLTGTTVGMTNQVRETGCSRTTTDVSPDVMFRFTLTTRQSVKVFTTTANAWDSILAIFNSSFTQLGSCSRVTATPFEETITVTLDPGTYYIVLDGRGTSNTVGISGAYGLRVQFNGGANCAGVLGAINCAIPGAAFGLGWFREYPLTPHGVSGNNPFVHAQDITTDFTLMQTAVNALTTEGNADWPESLSQGLYSAITGGGLNGYYPPRATNGAFSPCPAGTWGYGCFRNGAIPIVLAFTDAPVHEGPDQFFDYVLDERWPANTDIVVTGNEVQSNAYNIGDITSWISTSVRRTYRGSTTSMVDNYDNSVVGCNGTARDAVFRFTLTSRQRVQMTTYNGSSSFDTTVALFRNNITAADRVICNDDIYYSGTRSQITITLDPGTYYAVVDGYGGATGTYYLSFQGRPPGATAPVNRMPMYWDHTRQALVDRGVKFVGIRSCSPTATGDEGTYCADTLEDLQGIGTATSSVDDVGAPFVYTINNTGSGLGITVVQAITNLANYSRLNVRARATDNPVTAFDERNFVQSITVTSCPSSRCVGPRTGTLCGQCLPGTDVGFNVTFRNTGIAPSGVARGVSPQTFDFNIEFVGDDLYVLSSVPVRIVVPPIVPSYPAMGTYWRDIDSTARCAASERPDWNRFEWTAAIPTGTRIVFAFQGADTAAGVATAPRVTITTPTATSPVDMTALLRAGGVPDGLRYMRMTAELYSNTLRNVTPTLYRMAASYTCSPAE